MSRGSKASKSSEGESDQSRRFIEAARDLGADVSEEEFNDALRRIGRAPARKGEKEKKKGEPGT